MIQYRYILLSQGDPIGVHCLYIAVPTRGDSAIRDSSYVDYSRARSEVSRVGFRDSWCRVNVYICCAHMIFVVRPRPTRRSNQLLSSIGVSALGQHLWSSVSRSPSTGGPYCERVPVTIPTHLTPVPQTYANRTPTTSISLLGHNGPQRNAPAATNPSPPCAI